MRAATVGIWLGVTVKEEAVARYPNISDHGLIGDLQTAALVSTDGVVDWFCCPRFDSPSAVSYTHLTLPTTPYV